MYGRRMTSLKAARFLHRQRILRNPRRLFGSTAGESIFISLHTLAFAARWLSAATPLLPPTRACMISETSRHGGVINGSVAAAIGESLARKCGTWPPGLILPKSEDSCEWFLSDTALARRPFAFMRPRSRTRE